jgi:hypothetical protein
VSNWIVKIHLGVNNVQEFTSSDKPTIVDGLLTANWTSKVVPAFINYEKIYLITIEPWTMPSLKELVERTKGREQSTQSDMDELVKDAPGIIKFGKTRQ